jgi:hypothetical protein
MEATKSQLEFEWPSLDFPGRTALYPHECAARVGLSLQHIYDLIEEGDLIGVDFSGKNNLTDRRTLRIPLEEWRKFLLSRKTT